MPVKKIAYTFNLMCAFCCLLLFSILLLIQSSIHQMKSLLFMAVCLNALLLTILLFILIRQYRLFRSAKLILENQLLHIPAAMIENQREGGIDFYFSGFGMLLGDMVIPFDVRERKLSRLTFDEEAIIITYGTECKKRSVRILKTSMTENQVEDFRKKLYYETGIVASIHNEPAPPYMAPLQQINKFQ